MIQSFYLSLASSIELNIIKIIEKKKWEDKYYYKDVEVHCIGFPDVQTVVPKPRAYLQQDSV